MVYSEFHRLWVVLIIDAEPSWALTWLQTFGQYNSFISKEELRDHPVHSCWKGMSITVDQYVTSDSFVNAIQAYSSFDSASYPRVTFSSRLASYF